MIDALDRLRADYSPMAPQLLAPLLELLIAARSACGGDLDAFLILMTVGLRMAEHESFQRLSYDEVLTGCHAELPGYGVNMRSIAESSGIARETVRRKVEGLERAGLLARRDLLLFCTPAAFAAFAAVREFMLGQAPLNHRTVALLIGEAAL